MGVMYGSDKTDLVVKYYDVAFGVSGKAEAAWYLSTHERNSIFLNWDSGKRPGAISFCALLW